MMPPERQWHAARRAPVLAIRSVKTKLHFKCQIAGPDTVKWAMSSDRKRWVSLSPHAGPRMTCSEYRCC